LIPTPLQATSSENFYSAISKFSAKRPLVVNPLPGDFKVRHFRKPG
jgi:hypothetical protein